MEGERRREGDFVGPLFFPWSRGSLDKEIGNRGRRIAVRVVDVFGHRLPEVTVFVYVRCNLWCAREARA